MNEARYDNSLVAVFEDRATAEHAKQTLIQNGFVQDQIELTAADELARNVASGNAGLTGRPRDTSGGGISGFFHRLFGSHESAEDRKYYSDALTGTRSAVVVHASEEMIDRAAGILNDSGALSVEEETDSEIRDERVRGIRNIERADEARHGEAIPVVREELRVGKRPITRGAVRVYSQMTEQPVQENIPLREERVRVDRRKADRPATEADIEAANRGVIEVTETVEEPVVEKVARVVEEVVITKDVNERTQNVRDTLRRSDVRVEDAKGTRGGLASQTFDTDFRDDFRSRYGNQYRYEDFEPAYRYGYDMASDPRYHGRRFEDVENDLRTDYVQRNPNSTWERMKDSIRYGWDKMTGHAGRG